MAEPKRYFWLKLHKDFFKRKEIKRLRKIAGGDTYTIIYMEMLLRSIIDEGKLFFDGLEDDFASEIALDLDEDEENVKITIQYLLKTGLLEIRSEEEYYLPDTKDSTGSETSVAVRVRRHREKQKALQCNTHVTHEKHLRNGELEIELERELEIELERELETTTTERNEKKVFEKDIVAVDVVAVADELSKIAKLYLENGFGQASGYTSELLRQALLEYSFAWCEKALKITVEQGGKSWRYTQAILRDWKSKYDITAKPWEIEKNEQHKKGNRKDETEPTDWSNMPTDRW